jgi:hypothetical protein
MNPQRKNTTHIYYFSRNGEKRGEVKRVLKLILWQETLVGIVKNKNKGKCILPSN